jgi:hypothetical protein
MCKSHIYDPAMRSVATTDNTAFLAAIGSGEADTWLERTERVVLLLASLAVAGGLPFGVVEAQQAFAQAAREAKPKRPAHRAVSRMATTHRASQRESTHLRQVRSSPPQRRPMADELFAHRANDLACQGHHFSIPDFAMFR